MSNKTNHRTTYKQWIAALQTEIYADFSPGGKYHQILDLLSDQKISTGKAAEAIAEISLGFEPSLPDG